MKRKPTRRDEYVGFVTRGYKPNPEDVKVKPATNKVNSSTNKVFLGWQYNPKKPLDGN